MAYCPHCGKEVYDDAVVCVHCGRSIKQNYYNEPPVVNDAPNLGYAFLGFFFPIVGLILYIIWKNETPLRAKSAGKGALISVCISAGIYIIYFALFLLLRGGRIAGQLLWQIAI